MNELLSNDASHVGEHFVNGQDKNQNLGVRPQALLFITGDGGMENSLNYLVFSKEWVVFMLLPPFGIYRTYLPHK